MKIIYLCLTTLILCVSLVTASQVYGTVGVVCGEDLDVLPNNEIEITTPNFPNRYPSNANCTWRLCAKNPNHVIFLNFYIFQVENNPNCSIWDFVNLYDGEYLDPMKKIATFCGDNICYGYQAGFFPFDVIESNERCMTVSFCSDFLVEQMGFLARINSKFP